LLLHPCPSTARLSGAAVAAGRARVRCCSYRVGPASARPPCGACTVCAWLVLLPFGHQRAPPVADDARGPRPSWMTHVGRWESRPPSLRLMLSSALPLLPRPTSPTRTAAGSKGHGRHDLQQPRMKTT